VQLLHNSSYKIVLNCSLYLTGKCYLPVENYSNSSHLCHRCMLSCYLSTIN